MPGEDFALHGVRPVLFVHVSGSGGTTFCHQARRQPTAPYGLKAGKNFNCLLPCKSPYEYTLFGMHRQSWANRGCSANEHGWMALNCSALPSRMYDRGYHVMGATETLLDENNSPLLQPAIRLLASSASKCEDNCCTCNARSIFGGCGGQPVSSQRLPNGGVGEWCVGSRNRMVALRSKARSPFDRIWPLSRWQPLSTFCPNIQYVLLMNDPLKRLATQLLYRCPWAHHIDQKMNARRLAASPCPDATPPIPLIPVIPPPATHHPTQSHPTHTILCLAHPASFRPSPLTPPRAQLPTVGAGDPSRHLRLRPRRRRQPLAFLGNPSRQ